MKSIRRDGCRSLMGWSGGGRRVTLLVAGMCCLAWMEAFPAEAKPGSKSDSPEQGVGSGAGLPEGLLRRLQKDEPEAQYEAAQWCDARGTGIWEGQRAAGWYFLAARQGHAKARHRLGLMCLWGKGVVQNRMQALLWLTLAADELEEAKADLALCESQFQPAVLAAVKEGLLAEMEQGEREEKPEMLPGVPPDGFPLPPSLPAGVGEDCRLLEQAARLGHAPSQYVLGMYANDGLLGESDFELAAAWLQLAAGQGHAGAMITLADLEYSGGLGRHRSDYRYMGLLREAAARGDSRAMTKMADVAEVELAFVPGSNRGGASALEVSLAWHERALKAERDGAPGVATLYGAVIAGFNARIGTKEEPWRERAKELLHQLAAEEGSHGAVAALWPLIKQRDEDEASRSQLLPQLEYAAEAGNMSAQSELGELWTKADGDKKNLARGVAYLQRAARQGHSDAQERLGELCLSGRGVPVNKAEGWMWLVLGTRGLFSGAAERGAEGELPYSLKEHLPGTPEEDRAKGEAMARRFLPEREMPKEFDVATIPLVRYRDVDAASGPLPELARAAVQSLRDAAARGDGPAQARLALCEIYGGGLVELDIRAGLKRGAKAAAAGCTEAQVMLGLCLQNQTLMCPEYGMSGYWLGKAAAAGRVDARRQLAVVRSFSRQIKEGQREFLQLAYLGDARSQYGLGISAAYMEKEPERLVEMYRWYSLAAAQGLLPARVDAANLKRIMKKEDLARARERIVKFWPMPR